MPTPLRRTIAPRGRSARVPHWRASTTWEVTFCFWASTTGANTSLHLAEYRAEFGGKRVVTVGAPVLVEGARTWLSFEDIHLDESDFSRLGQEFEAVTGSVVVGRVGLATARLMPQRALVDIAVSWMERFRGR